MPRWLIHHFLVWQATYCTGWMKLRLDIAIGYNGRARIFPINILIKLTFKVNQPINFLLKYKDASLAL